MSRRVAYFTGRRRRFVDANAAYRRAPASGALSTAVVAKPSPTLRVGDTAVIDGATTAGVVDVDEDAITLDTGDVYKRSELSALAAPDAGCPVFVRYPETSPAVWMGRNLPVICRSETPGAVYVGVMHTRQCKQHYRNASTLLVQVLGQVTMQLVYSDGEWVAPSYMYNDTKVWNFGQTTHPSGGVRLDPPGRVNRRRAV